MRRITVIIMILALGMQLSCKKKNDKQTISSNNSEYHSYYSTSKSHNNGKDCLSCHYKGGPGETTFSLGGSVYDTTFVASFPKATLRLYTGAGGSGELKYTIEVDALGNFYTTSVIDFSTPLYPVMTGNTASKYMSFSIQTGACNSCHGVTTNKLFAF